MHASTFRMAAAQSSSVKGRTAENVARHAEFVSVANEHSASVVVFPELSLTGYEPTLAAELAIDPNAEVVQPLRDASENTGITIVAGCPIRSAGSLPFIGALIFHPHQLVTVYRKRFLHADEEQHFCPSNDTVVFPCHGQQVGVAICADVNHAEHPLAAAKQNATVYAAGVAMTPGGIDQAVANLARYAAHHQMPTMMANYAAPTGGFPMAGQSGIWNESGESVVQAPSSGECLVMAEMGGEGVGQVVSMQ